MVLYERFRQLISQILGKYSVSPIQNAYFPPYFDKKSQKSAEFMCLQLENGGCGISYVLLPRGSSDAYKKASQLDYRGVSPVEMVEWFGAQDPVKNMIGLAAINAICQHVMKKTHFPLETATDSLGDLNLNPNDKVGMVGLFRPLLKRVEATKASLIILEKNQALLEQHPEYPITLDPEALRQCDKVMCTSTVVYNNTLDDILSHCREDAFVSIIGPTAGYFPDPLFEKGVDMVGGTFISDDDQFLALLEKQLPWRNVASKFSFRRSTYKGVPGL